MSDDVSGKHYDQFMARKSSPVNQVVFGSGDFPAHLYSEQAPALYRTPESLLPRLHQTLRSLADHALEISRLTPLGAKQEEVVEYYNQQTTQFWADLGELKGFLGLSPQISELVTELITARFQFIGKNTPPAVMTALAQALGIAADANQYDTALVDSVVETLEAEGMDSLAFDALRKPDL